MYSFLTLVVAVLGRGRIGWTLNSGGVQDLTFVVGVRIVESEWFGFAVEKRMGHVKVEGELMFLHFQFGYCSIQHLWMHDEVSVVVGLSSCAPNLGSPCLKRIFYHD